MPVGKQGRTVEKHEQSMFQANAVSSHLECSNPLADAPASSYRDSRHLDRSTSARWSRGAVGGLRDAAAAYAEPDLLSESGRRSARRSESTWVRRDRGTYWPLLGCSERLRGAGWLKSFRLPSLDVSPDGESHVELLLMGGSRYWSLRAAQLSSLGRYSALGPFRR